MCSRLSASHVSYNAPLSIPLSLAFFFRSFALCLNDMVYVLFSIFAHDQRQVLLSCPPMWWLTPILRSNTQISVNTKSHIPHTILVRPLEIRRRMSAPMFRPPSPVKAVRSSSIVCGEYDDWVLQHAAILQCRLNISDGLVQRCYHGSILSSLWMLDVTESLWRYTKIDKQE